jgi:sporulation protein YlmC with PRC-barrel domain
MKNELSGSTGANGITGGGKTSYYAPARRRQRFKGNHSHEARPARQAEKLFSASGLLESLVRDARGKRLGEIEDFILDVVSGRIEYVVFSFGGLFGLGSRLCAVRPNMLRVDEHNGCVSLDYDKAQLGNVPTFDKYKWPYMRQAAQAGHIYILRGERHHHLLEARN